MKRSRTSVLIALALTAGLGPAAMAGAAPKGDSASDRARAEHERIVAHWTPERMRAAKPRDFERLPDGSFVLAPDAKGKPDSSAGKGKPGGGGGGDTTPATVTGASWPGLETPVNEQTGKVYFQFTDTDGWICSGTVLDDGGDASRSLVLTAGHCLYDQATKSFAKNWLFIPDFDEAPTYDCSAAEYGCWTATALVAHEGFTSQAKFNTEAALHDFAVAVVGSGGRNRDTDLTAAVGGSYTLAVGGGFVGATMNAFGYPASKKYNGSVLTYCSGPATTDPYNGGLTWGLTCNMTGGSSGGPWFDSTLDLTTGAGGAVASLNSYGYRGLNYMFGPKFTDKTTAVYNAALNGGSGVTGVDYHAVP